jgi:arylsulfatase A-like enzyme
MFCRDHAKHISLEGRCNQVNLGKEPLMKVKLTRRDLQAVSDHYDSGIACADADLGALFDALRAMRLYEEALIIVTSDHGESLGSHDQIGHGGLYLEQLRVPLIIKFPVSWKIAPRVIDEPVELVDLMPTAYDACGIELPQGLDGRSLMPLIRHGTWKRRFTIAQTTHQEGRDAITNAAKRAVLVPSEWLLIHDARAQEAELFDLTADPRGLADVRTGKAEAVGNLMAALTAHDPGPPMGEFVMPESEQMSDELRRQLETLGYIGR